MASSVRAVVVSLVALILLVPSRGSAQVLQSFGDLALRVNLGDRIRVEDQAGGKASGRLIRLTRDELAIQTDAGERRFTRDTVREVAMRGHSLRKGALIGSAALAALSALVVCSREGGGDCVIAPFGAAPIGAGFGLAMGALIARMRTIYRAPEGGAAMAAAPAVGGAQASLLEDLALKVNLGDQLRVEDQSGGSTTGRLTRLTAGEITIHTDVGDKLFRPEAVRQVAVRRRPLRLAVLIGAGAGVATGAVAACTGPDREACEDAPILGAAVGAGLGLAVGALLHKTTIVYPEGRRALLVSPVVSRGAVGVRVSVSWPR